jgi:hypothetical protein
MSSINNQNYLMLPHLRNSNQAGTTTSISLKTTGIKHQSWYKERLREKYSIKENLKAIKTRDKIIDPKQWIFIEDGLDDFRAGVPPSHNQCIIKPNKGPSPSIKGETRVFKNMAQNKTKKLFTREQLYYSNKLPNKELRKDKIERLIESLMNNSLESDQDLKDALPSDVNHKNKLSNSLTIKYNIGLTFFF